MPANSKWDLIQVLRVKPDDEITTLPRVYDPNFPSAVTTGENYILKSCTPHPILFGYHKMK